MSLAHGSRKYVIAGTSYSREEVIHRYLHLVKYVAGRISVNLPPNVELNDLINDGILGLIDAIEKYDDDRGVKFETYAITRINGAILDALRALDWVPRAVRQRARELEKTAQALEIELGRAPNDDEIALRMGISVQELGTIQQKIRGSSVLSLEEHLPSDRGSDIPLLDTLRDTTSTSPHPSNSAKSAPRSSKRSRSFRIRNERSSSSTTSRARRSRTSRACSASRNRASRRFTRKPSSICAPGCANCETTSGYRDNDPSVKQKYVRKPPAPAKSPAAR